MSQTWRISRRTVLAWTRHRGRPAAAGRHGAGSGAAPTPRKLRRTRMAFVYVPNGMHMPDWTPGRPAQTSELPYILEPLKDVQRPAAGAERPGPGPWPRQRRRRRRPRPALSAFLPARRPARRTAPTSRSASRSTRSPPARSASARNSPRSELGCDRGAQAGNCDSGYSCSYSTNISWRTDDDAAGQGDQPQAGLRAVVLRRPAPRRASNRANSIARASSISCSKTPATSRQARASKDRRKLDEYLTSVRELEQRIATAGSRSPRRRAQLSAAHRHSRRTTPNTSA